MIPEAEPKDLELLKFLMEFRILHIMCSLQTLQLELKYEIDLSYKQDH